MVKIKLSKRREAYYKQLEEDLRSGNLSLTQCIEDFKEVMRDLDKEFITELKKRINRLQKDKLNPIDYTTSRRREFNNNLNKINEIIDLLF